MVTTVIFCSIARLRYAISALGSFAASTMAFSRWVISVLVYETCDEADESEGPTTLPSAPISLHAAIEPPVSITLYGLLMFFGTNASLRPCLIGFSSACAAVASRARQQTAK